MDIPGGEVPALVERFTGKIHFCQIRDHTARWPEGREVPPGEGGVDLAGVVRALKAAGYRGPVHPEHLGKPRFEGEDLLAKAVGYTRSLLEAA
jgi:sugar phosphate isomerase/epimerase